MGYYQAHLKDLKSDQFGPWSLTPSVHRFIKQFFFLSFLHLILHAELSLLSNLYLSPLSHSHSTLKLTVRPLFCLWISQNFIPFSRSRSARLLLGFFFPPFVSVSPSLLQWLHQSSGIELIFLFPLPLIFDYLILHFWNLGFFFSFFGPSSVLLSFAFDWFCWRSILLIWLFLF